MTGKSYYITTLADWQRHAHRFAQSHWIALDSPCELAAQAEFASDAKPSIPAATPRHVECGGLPPLPAGDGAGKILVMIEADEGVHLALEDDPAYEALPYPLAQRPISASAQSALVSHGVPPGATTFEATEAAARLHPLLKHRVF